jgi:hypothetical protein
MLSMDLVLELDPVLELMLNLEQALKLVLVML